MFHHIHRHGRRFGHRIFKILLIVAIVLGVIFLIRRHNLRKSGIQPKPIFEDMGEMYRQVQYRFESGDLSGIVDQVLGKGPVAA